MQIIELFLPALILIFLLVYIHAIFGIEIIKRGVIFTDLAIGQISAIGIAISVVFFDGGFQSAFVFIFALIGALLITYATQKIEHIEAFIGMLYALGASTIMMILANTPDAMELFSKLSATDILFTSTDEVYKSATLYLFISIIMFKLYPRTSGLIKELIFFVSLAMVVTSSVQSAGVLVVFTLLVSPAFIALHQKRFKPLFFAWSFGITLSILAIIISYNFDLPTGYSIVFVMSFASVLSMFKRDN
ncbi:Zinc ABC transporter, inner membrane permease protein ZnuB [hydrothermal vent metagenome]|uniref:Zinc ABC transporter, inner membrane permease protein ZnuB n=1 Tax=hydrothermal vent metagenome TaxID=652676 RepID=A0A1W1EKF6_9ZZZZ